MSFLKLENQRSSNCIFSFLSLRMFQRNHKGRKTVKDECTDIAQILRNHDKNNNSMNKHSKKYYTRSEKEVKCVYTTLSTQFRCQRRDNKFFTSCFSFDYFCRRRKRDMNLVANIQRYTHIILQFKGKEQDENNNEKNTSGFDETTKSTEFYTSCSIQQIKQETHFIQTRETKIRKINNKPLFGRESTIESRIEWKEVSQETRQGSQ